jgi:hypothetical protein
MSIILHMLLCFLGVFIGAVPKASERPPLDEIQGGRRQGRASAVES